MIYCGTVGEIPPEILISSTWYRNEKKVVFSR